MVAAPAAPTPYPRAPGVRMTVVKTNSLKQSVVNNIAQLYGRGFPRIFHMKLVLSQHHVFLFSTFSYPSQLKHLVVRAFLAGDLPKNALKTRCFR